MIYRLSVLNREYFRGVSLECMREKQTADASLMKEDRV